METTAPQSHLDKLVHGANGRICAGACGRKKPWSEFHLKPKGLNGRDSQCRSCIALARKRKKRHQEYEKKLLGQTQLTTIVIGNLDDEVTSEFGGLFAKGIIGLIERGQI